MGWIEGLLGGITERKSEIEALNLEESRLAQAREANVYQALLKSDDPQIVNMAVAGLLDSTQPRKKKGGMRGWLGETEQSPTFQRLQSFLNTPRQETVIEQKETLPATFGTGATVTPTVAQTPTTAGMPPDSAVEPGAPPMPAMSYTQSPPMPYEVATQQMRTPQIFLTPEQRLRQAAHMKGVTAGMEQEGEITGEYTALRKYMSHEEALDIIKRRRGGGLIGAQSIAGEMPDGKGGFVPAFASFDRVTSTYRDPETGRPMTGFRPRSATATTGRSMGVDYNRAAFDMGFNTPAEVPVERRDELERRAGEITRGLSQERATGSAAAPLSTNQQFQALTDLQESWRKAEAPRREMERQLQLMETGINRFRQGDKIGGSQAVLVTFQKILDPTSVVRESEYARSPQGLSVMGRIEGFIERLKMGGAGVPEPELAAMVGTARQFLSGMADWNNIERQRLTDTATTFKLNPQMIFGAPLAGPPPAPSGGNLDSPVPGLFVDDKGNLIRR